MKTKGETSGRGRKAPGSHSRSALKVLVVDDDPGLLELMGVVLEEQGFSVDTATCSQGALLKAGRIRYDLAIVDLILPDADGVLLLAKLGRISPGLESRTIFMTGFTSKEAVLDFLKSTAAGFLQKPFGADQLLRAVRKVSCIS